MKPAKYLASLLTVAILGLSSCQKDPCKKVTCQNGGTCVNGSCQCSLPYEGSSCEIDARDKFVGIWEGELRCGSDYQILIGTIKKSSNPKQLVFDDTYIAEMTSSNTFTFLQQIIDEDGDYYRISGEGRLEGISLTITLTYDSPTQGRGYCILRATRR